MNGHDNTDKTSILGSDQGIPRHYHIMAVNANGFSLICRGSIIAGEEARYLELLLLTSHLLLLLQSLPLHEDLAEGGGGRDLKLDFKELMKDNNSILP